MDGPLLLAFASLLLLFFLLWLEFCCCSGGFYSVLGFCLGRFFVFPLV